MLVTFFIINETFYKIQLAWAKVVNPIYTLNVHQHLKCTRFFISFYREITLLNMKYNISVQRHISLRQLSGSRITVYPNKAICNTCPKDVMFTYHIFEWQIQRIFDYSRFSMKRDQVFESRFFKLSFHILVI